MAGEVVTTGARAADTARVDAPRDTDPVTDAEQTEAGAASVPGRRMADQAEAPAAAAAKASSAGERELTRLIAARIRDVPDYPQPGVLFKDITPLLADGEAFRAVIDVLAETYGPVDKVAGIEARGFILAAPVAARLGAGFVPIRKKGKLPGVTFAQDYQLEYGTATIEVLTDAFDPGDRVLVIDDVLATGGTARATADLVQRAGARVAGISVLLELAFLHGRAKLADLPVTALITV